MADCQMHLVRLLLAAYHTYTWIDPGLKVLRDTETCNVRTCHLLHQDVSIYLSRGVSNSVSQAVSLGVVLQLQGVLVEIN